MKIKINRNHASKTLASIQLTTPGELVMFQKLIGVTPRVLCEKFNEYDFDFMEQYEKLTEIIEQQYGIDPDDYPELIVLEVQK